MDESKERPKQVATVINQKPSGFIKFIKLFLPKDINEIKKDIITEVIIPSSKEFLNEVWNTFLWGKSGQKSSSRSTGVKQVISYNSGFFDRREPVSQRPITFPTSPLEYEQFIFPTRADAESVIDGLSYYLSQSGMATLQDLYDLVGKTCPYTYEKYGWRDISTVHIERVRNGYALKLPPAKPL